jgi:DNA-binding PadR family transcriptional regulator
MAPRASSSKEVLLGLLAVAPMSGYDLGQAIRDSIGHFWNESYGQIYPNLKRLAADGYVARKTEKQKGRPDKQIYSITAKGLKRLQAWLAVEPQPEIPRNELLLKLFFGTQVAPEIMIGFVQRMAEQERAVLSKLGQIEREEVLNSEQYPDAPYWKMALRFGQLELEAHQRWAEETLVTLRKMPRPPQTGVSTARKGRHHAGK